MQRVRKISCLNDGGFVMRFRTRWNEKGKIKSSGWTGWYAVGKSRSKDLRKLSIPEGIEVWIEADARLGKQKDSWEHVIYEPNNDNVGNYRVYGSTYYVKVDLLD